MTPGPDVAGTLIEIAEVGRIPTGGFTATVRFGDQPKSHPITVVDPADRAIEDLFTWYYERYQQFPIGQAGKRGRAEDALAKYGVDLFKQIFSHEVGEGDVYRWYEECREVEFENCRLRISGTEEFHRLHWEAIRDPRVDKPLSVRLPIKRFTTNVTNTFRLRPPGSILNILVAVARPFGGDDIEYRTISRTLIATAWKALTPVRVDLSRPGTWPALVNHLDRVRRDAKYTGYQVVHFDLHGEVLTYPALRQRIEQGKLRPHRRSIEEFPDQRAFLYFETDTDGVADPVPAADVATLLADNRISLAVLNACQSANGSGSDGGMAQQLAQAGVPIVVGMAYTVTVAAAAQAIPLIYESLAEGRTPEEAVQDARRDLYQSPARPGVADESVDLQDWLLPVLFQQQNVNLQLAKMTPTDDREYHSLLTRGGDEPTETIGRDIDVLAVERRLLGEGSPRVVLIRGAAGVGKTDFLDLLRWWWLRTGLVDGYFRYSFDDGRVSPEAIVDDLGRRLLPAEFDAAAGEPWEARLGRVARRLRSDPQLIIVDSGRNAMTAEPNGLPVAERGKFLQLLAQLRGGRTLVIIASRQEEEWLTALRPAIARYELGVPPPLASRRQVEPSEPSEPSEPVGPVGPSEPAVTWAPEFKAPITVTTPSQVKEPSPATLARRGTRVRLAAGVLGAVLVGSGVVAIVAHSSGTPITSPTTSVPRTTISAARSTSAGGGIADPVWLVGAAAPGIAIVAPEVEAKVGACFTLRGTASGLGADQTLLAAIRRSDAYPGDPFYFWRPDRWDNPAALAQWSVQVPTGQSSGQEYDLYVLVADRNSVRRVFDAAPATVTSDQPIAGLRRAAHVRVQQSSALNAC